MRKKKSIISIMLKNFLRLKTVEILLRHKQTFYKCKWTIIKKMNLILMNFLGSVFTIEHISTTLKVDDPIISNINFCKQFGFNPEPFQEGNDAMLESPFIIYFQPFALNLLPFVLAIQFLPLFFRQVKFSMLAVVSSYTN